MKKCLIFLSVLLIAVFLLVSCGGNVDVPQIETTSPELTENTTTSTVSTEQTTESAETPTTEITTQAEITTPTETTAQTEIITPIETTEYTETTTNTEYTTPTETTKEKEPTTEAWPKIVSAETIIIDKITDKFKYGDVKKFLDNENDMASFTNQFNVKYYKSIPVKNDTAISRVKEGTKTKLYLNEHFMTIVLTTPGYLIVDYYFGDKYTVNNLDETPLGKGYMIKYNLISFSSDEIEEIIKNFEKGTNVAEVFRTDPDGKYEFLHASWTQYPAYSYHYFKDGTGIEIKYDSDWNIERITLFYL